jgi:hypothetical protein
MESENYNIDRIEMKLIINVTEHEGTAYQAALVMDDLIREILEKELADDFELEVTSFQRMSHSNDPALEELM